MSVSSVSIEIHTALGFSMSVSTFYRCAQRADLV